MATDTFVPEKSIPASRSEGADRDEIGVSRLMATILRQWRIVAGATLVALVIGLAYEVLRPKRYAAVTVLVPAQSAQSDFSMFANQLGDLPFPIPMRQNRDNERILSAIARSRLLADSMVRRITNGREDRGVERDVRIALAKHSTFRKNPDGSLVVQVSDRLPRRAAEIANHFPSLLNNLVTQMGVQVTHRKQENLREQLNQALAQLEVSESRLVEFRRTGAAPIIEAQAQQTLEAAGQVQRAIMEHELKIAQMRRSMTPENPELTAAVGELGTLRKQLRRLTEERAASGDVFVPMRSAPGITAGQLRLEREFARDEQIYIALSASMAQTQIDMIDNLPVVSVLDSAEVPSTPTGISLLTLLILAACLGMFVGLGLAFWAEFWTRARSDPESRVLVEAWTDLKRDLLQWRSRWHVRREAELPQFPE